MSPHTIRRLFPLASASVLAANAGDYGDGQPCAPEPVAAILAPSAGAWSIRITGQVRGGKNNITVTRTGHRFPNRAWAAWRDIAVAEVRAQLPAGWMPISEPVNVALHYIAGDKRRRDCPAIVDAAWHVLEKAGVVADDTLLWPVLSTRSYNKQSPSITISSIQ